MSQENSMSAPLMGAKVVCKTPEIPKVSIADGLKYGVYQAGVAPFAQIKEILGLSRAPGKVSIQDYYYYRLYDKKYSAADKLAFVGSRLEQKLHRLVFDRKSAALVNDKLLYEKTLSKLGLPVPETQCVYQKRGDTFAFDRCHSSDEISRWLRDTSGRALFGKPRFGIRSNGVASIQGYDADADRLRFASGETLAVDDYVEQIHAFCGKGYLFQQRLIPHDTVITLAGSTIATVRMIVLMDDDGPRLHRAVWKLPTGNAVADNYWRDNILANVDIDSGVIHRAIQGVGLATTETQRHPDTGAPLVGVKVPIWEQMVECCLAASHAIPGIDMQAWDVAATSKGPVLMEVNIGGDYNLPQLAADKGMLEPEFVEFLARCARRRGREWRFDRLKLRQALPQG